MVATPDEWEAHIALTWYIREGTAEFGIITERVPFGEKPKEERPLFTSEDRCNHYILNDDDSAPSTNDVKLVEAQENSRLPEHKWVHIGGIVHLQWSDDPPENLPVVLDQAKIIKFSLLAAEAPDNADILGLLRTTLSRRKRHQDLPSGDIPRMEINLRLVLTVLLHIRDTQRPNLYLEINPVSLSHILNLRLPDSTLAILMADSPVIKVLQLFGRIQQETFSLSVVNLSSGLHKLFLGYREWKSDIGSGRCISEEGIKSAV